MFIVLHSLCRVPYTLGTMVNEASYMACCDLRVYVCGALHDVVRVTSDVQFEHDILLRKVLTLADVSDMIGI